MQDMQTLYKPTLFDQGVNDFYNCKYKPAIDCFNEWLLDNPEDDRAYSKRAHCWYLDENKYSKHNIQDYIEKDTANALEHNPSNSEAYLVRGLLKNSRNDSTFETDLQMVESLLEHKNCFESYWLRGSAQLHLGSFESAITNCNKAIKLNPSCIIGYLTRAYANAELENYSVAIKDLDTYIECNSNYFVSYYSRAYAKAEQSDLSGAHEDYSRAIEICPDYSDAYFSRAIINERLQDYQGAIVDYTQVIKLNPVKVDAYLNRAKLLMLLQDDQGAIADYTQVIKLNSVNVDAYLNRAELLMSLKGPIKAAVSFFEGLEYLFLNQAYQEKLISFMRQLSFSDKCSLLQKNLPMQLLVFGSEDGFNLQELSDVLAESRSLLILTLELSSEVTEEEYLLLSTRLLENNNIVSLHISGSIPSSLTKELVDKLKQQPMFVEPTLSGNDIPDEEQEMIDPRITRNGANLNRLIDYLCVVDKQGFDITSTDVRYLFLYQKISKVFLRYYWIWKNKELGETGFAELLNKVDSFIHQHFFQLACICKQERILSRLNTDVLTCIGQHVSLSDVVWTPKLFSPSNIPSHEATPDFKSNSITATQNSNGYIV